MLSGICNVHSLQVFLIVGPAFILYGYNQSGLSSLLTLPDMLRYLPQVSSSTIKGVVNAILQLGALVGALSCSKLGGILGRRKTIFVAGILTTIGHILQCTSFSLAQFVVGRVILGFGIGQLSVTGPVWQSECSFSDKRGRRVIAAGIYICVGFALASWVDFGFSKVAFEPVQWRVPLALPTLFSLMITFSIFKLPESPRWLIQMGRIEEATKTLAWLNGLSIEDPSIQLEVARIESAIESAPTASLKDLFSTHDEARLKYRLFLCITIQCMQQLVGGNVIATYTKTIFETDLQLKGDLPAILAACCMTWKFLFSFVAFATIDTLGRRKIFVISGVGMCLCMIMMTIATRYASSSYGASIAAAIATFLFNIFYPIGFLGGHFLYCTEVAPVRLRVAMTSLSTANHWLWNFTITMITPVALANVGWKYYIVFCCTTACVPVLIPIFFPETMKRNLEVLDRVFTEAPSIWDIVPMAARLPVDDGHTAQYEPDRKPGIDIEEDEHREFA